MLLPILSSKIVGLILWCWHAQPLKNLTGNDFNWAKAL
jgi:hypothetical protein